MNTRYICNYYTIKKQIENATRRRVKISFKLRREFVVLTTRLPNLWTPSYYAGTVGQVSQETVKKYIQNQKKR